MTDLVAAAGVGWIALEDAVYVARLPDGPIHALEGSAAVLWKTALTVDGDELASAVAAMTELPLEQVESDVAAFVEDLIERGLMMQVP